MPVKPRTVRRAGMTLVEIVVALGLFAIVTSLILGIVRGQQRFHVGTLEVVDTKRSVQQAVALLYGDLRAASSADIYTASDTSIALRATRGASYLCAIDSARSVVTLPSIARRGVTGLTTLLVVPRAGDSVLVLDSGDSPESVDDRWRAHVLVSNPAGGTCPLRPLGLAANAAEASGITIAVAPAVSATVLVGAPLRFFVPVQYALYRGAGGWMLGYSTCPASSCGGRQPLSGPYTPFATAGAAGIAFQYFDVLGAPASDPPTIARVDVVARARSASVLDVGHIRGQRYQDSLALTIALRNPS